MSGPKLTGKPSESHKRFLRPEYPEIPRAREFSALTGFHPHIGANFFFISQEVPHGIEEASARVRGQLRHLCDLIFRDLFVLFRGQQVGGVRQRLSCGSYQLIGICGKPGNHAEP